MNKIIFQIGLLAFCLSVVYFGGQGLAVIQTIARSFIVFIAVVVSITLLVIAATTMGRERHSPEHGASRPPQPPGQHNAGAQSPAAS